MAEAKTLRKEISRIAGDYDISWQGELENLSPSQSPRDSGPDANEGEKIDVDKTIDEAEELASQSEEQRAKERASARRGGEGTAPARGSEMDRVEKGERRANRLAKKGVED